MEADWIGLFVLVIRPGQQYGWGIMSRMQPDAEEIDVFQVERSLWVAEAKIGRATYDFSFASLFACTHSRFGLEEVIAVGRFGGVEDYGMLFESLLGLGVKLVNSPEQHELCSELPLWYPPLSGLTPESWWFDQPPDPKTAGELAGWPLFMKGSRHTKRHQAKFSILANEEEYRAAAEFFLADAIMSSQQTVIRRFVPLQPVEAEVGEHIPASYEFRTFWWRGECVGAGPYFAAFSQYDWTAGERQEALALAGDAARRLDVPFLGVDVAKQKNGCWTVIEVNDAQDCGYTGVRPLPMWQAIVEIEKRRSA